MGIKRDGKGRRREIRRGFSVESLERRALLTVSGETFIPPSLGQLITQAEHGKTTYPTQINLMVGALKTQLVAGPLANLAVNSVTGNGFVTEAQALEASFEQDVDLQIGSRFQAIDELLKLQGRRVVADLVALNQQEAVGLIGEPALLTAAGATISSLTGGPIQALNTSTAAITTETRTFQAELAAIIPSSLAPTQVATTLGAEAEAYRADLHAGIQATQLRISGEADTAIDALESAANAFGRTPSSATASGLTNAVTKFEATVLDTSGLFAAHGALSRSHPSRLNPTRTNGQATSKFASLSGTATVGGLATLTATLSDANGSPLMGESVAFTLDGAFAGVGITNFTGVAVVGSVPTTDGVGSDASGIVASFAGDTNFLPTAANGPLAVAQAPTTVGGVAGTASFGGPATLTATLASAATGQGLAGRPVAFELDGTSVGSALTNAAGVATLTGVTTVDPVGSDASGLTASFAGDANDAAGASTGTLVISQAGTVLSNVGATAQVGGTATLMATLSSTASGKGVAGETVNFVLDGTIVGTGTTNASGVATLSGVSTTRALGTDVGGVIATFGGDANHLPAANATGNLVVSLANTSLLNVTGTVLFGGKATLSATLTSSATSEGLAGKTVTFALNGAVVGTAVTDSAGLATLSGVATDDPVGTNAGAVVATFAGDGTDTPTTTTGNLVVSQATTSLGSISGTASFGGTATLSATLTSTAANAPLAGQAVSFTLGGTAVGTAVTNAAGTATLTGVSQSDAVGSISRAVAASFAGTLQFEASSGTGAIAIAQAPTALGSVSGVSSVGGKATLMATLTSEANGKPVDGETVKFTLDGVAVGSGLTDANGVATLTMVATTAGVGTQAGSIVASFAGDTNYLAAANATGNLVVGQGPTTLQTVAGTASFGGPATLTATLKSTLSTLGLAGETVAFSLDGKSVGTAKTDGNGVATLTGVPTTDAVGETGSIAASFAGDASYAAATPATGKLVVSQAGTTLGAVAGTARFSGKATLVATLTSAVTKAPIAGETVAFTLAGVAVGTAVTDAQGVATLTGVTPSVAIGTATGAVTAAFAGDASNSAAANATGDLVVSQAATTVTNVLGTGPVGGPVSLTATLTSGVTNLPLPGQIVTFTLDGTVVGTMTTDQDGVATLTDVPTSDMSGDTPNAVVADFGPTIDYLAGEGRGDLILS